MKKFASALLAASLLTSTIAVAQPDFSGGSDRYEQYRQNPRYRMSEPRYSRGDRLAPRYRTDREYVVNDWRQRKLRKPPRGYHWVRNDNNDYFLAAITTGIILQLLLNGERDNDRRR